MCPHASVHSWVTYIQSWLIALISSHNTLLICWRSFILVWLLTHSSALVWPLDSLTIFVYYTNQITALYAPLEPDKASVVLPLWTRWRVKDLWNPWPQLIISLHLQEAGSLSGLQTPPSRSSGDRISHGNDKFTKKSKNQQNQAVKLSDEQEGTAGRSPVLQTQLHFAAIEEDIIKKATMETDVILPFKSNGKRKSTSAKKKQRQQSTEAMDSLGSPPVHQRSVIVSAPSEGSIISAAAVEELCHLRSYYGRQLQRIDYVSHENLNDTDSAIVTCTNGALRSLRLPWGSSFAKSVRSLWTRVSTRRRHLIRRGLWHSLYPYLFAFVLVLLQNNNSNTLSIVPEAQLYEIILIFC